MLSLLPLFPSYRKPYLRTRDGWLRYPSACERRANFHFTPRTYAARQSHNHKRFNFTRVIQTAGSSSARHDIVLFSKPNRHHLDHIVIRRSLRKVLSHRQNLYTFCQDHNDTVPVVGIWLERSIDLHLAILGTTISGAAWLPFDADAPATRVRTCLEDSNACVLPDCIC